MRKIFIDGGAHMGESIDLFRATVPEHVGFEIHSFEPNPAMWELLEKKGVTLHRYGLWNKDENRYFYIGKFSEGSTYVQGKVSGKVDYSHPVPSRCIRLSKWIQDNFTKDDFIILKLDIEGAEYAVLDDLINTGVMVDYIDVLCGELHSTGVGGRIVSMPHETKSNMEHRLKDMGIKFMRWNDHRNNESAPEFEFTI